ncbi:hypothetical protein H6758_03060 [Candidatus Nomurabacteria bacterium]|nr:hypothetical protein [Candidatus Nomurabacteria bacterium]
MKRHFLQQSDPNGDKDPRTHAKRAWVGLTNAGVPGVPLDFASNLPLAMHEATVAGLLTPRVFHKGVSQTASF